MLRQEQQGGGNTTSTSELVRHDPAMWDQRQSFQTQGNMGFHFKLCTNGHQMDQSLNHRDEWCDYCKKKCKVQWTKVGCYQCDEWYCVACGSHDDPRIKVTMTSASKDDDWSGNEKDPWLDPKNDPWNSSSSAKHSSKKNWW